MTEFADAIADMQQLEMDAIHARRHAADLAERADRARGRVRSIRDAALRAVRADERRVYDALQEVLTTGTRADEKAARDALAAARAVTSDAAAGYVIPPVIRPTDIPRRNVPVTPRADIAPGGLSLADLGAS